MKKLFITAAVMMIMLSTAAYADSVDLNGDVTAGRETEITGLADGYYDLTVTCKNTAVDENAYLYGVSDGYTKSSTVLPKSADGVTVTVRGIGVSGGKCKIGVMPNSLGTVEFSNADLKASKESNFIVGGDMTEVSYIESLGGAYKDAEGNKTDPFKYLAANGVNMARIRLSNTTGKGTGDGTYYLPGGFQDEADCLALSKRAHDAGMGIQFTFNYSDYWSNGDRQIIPSEWVKRIKEELGYDVKDASFLKAMTAAQKKEIQNKLGDIVYEYTYDIMTKLKEQGTVPEYVSLGNEINGGMFFPFANTFNANMNSNRFELVYDDKKDEANDIKCYKDWSGLANILNRGYDAVKAVSPESQVIIHLANGSKDSIFTWFFDEYKKAGGKFDVIGASYYPAWTQNPVETCVSFCNSISSKYNKDIMIMEVGYNWNKTKKNGYEGQLTSNAPGYNEKYPFTQEGHCGFMADMINGMKSVNNGRCAGILYWDPCMIHVEDPSAVNESLSGWAINESDDKPAGNVVENTTLFDFDGKAIKTVAMLNNTRNAGKISEAPEPTVKPTEQPTPMPTPAQGLTGTQPEVKDGFVVSVVTNNTNEAKKANLYAAVYDADGVLRGVMIDSAVIEKGESKELKVEKPSQDYRTFLWNGENLTPIGR